MQSVATKELVTSALDFRKVDDAFRGCHHLLKKIAVNSMARSTCSIIIVFALFKGVLHMITN
jgi:hypothetical protein